MFLYEAYRPKTWAEVIGQDKVLAKIEALRPRGLSGRAYWISGAGGTGKTTIALLLAAEVAEGWNIQELDAAELTADYLREYSQNKLLRGLGTKSGRAWIVNEAHGLRAEMVRRLLCVLEPIPAHCIWIFTTTTEGQAKLFADLDDAGPFLSRCHKLPLARQGLARPFAERAREIAHAEGLDGAPPEKYYRLLQDCANNFRAALDAIEEGAMRG